MRHALLLLLALLAGCAGRPPALTSLDGQQYWQAEGRLALKSGQGGGNLNFTWAQLGEHYRLALSGPLGVGNTELMVGPGNVSLQHPELGLLRPTARRPCLKRAPASGRQSRCWHTGYAPKRPAPTPASNATPQAGCRL